MPMLAAGTVPAATTVTAMPPQYLQMAGAAAATPMAMPMQGAPAPVTYAAVNPDGAAPPAEPVAGMPPATAAYYPTAGEGAYAAPPTTYAVPQTAVPQSYGAAPPTM